MKKTLVGMALISGLSISSAQAMEHDWEWSVGDFYINAAAGWSQDKHLGSGDFNGSSLDGSVSGKSQYHTGGNQHRGGMRQGFGYRQTVGDNWRLGLETGMGHYGTHRVIGALSDATGGANNLSGHDLLLHYQGLDALLTLGYEFDGGHLLGLKLGGQRTKIDLEFQQTLNGDIDTGAHALPFRSKYGTRYKAAVNYEYKLKDNVGVLVDYSHMFGQHVTAYTETITPGLAYIGRPNAIPTIDTVMIGFQLYF